VPVLHLTEYPLHLYGTDYPQALGKYALDKTPPHNPLIPTDYETFLHIRVKTPLPMADLAKAFATTLERQPSAAKSAHAQALALSDFLLGCE
jgi:hypothetical protein